MHDFERQEPVQEDAEWEDQIQFVDLDPAGKVSLPGRLLGMLPPPSRWRKARWWIVGVTSIALLALLIQTGWAALPFNQGGKQALVHSSSTGLPSAILLATPQAIYTLDVFGNLNALDARNGRQLWHYRPSLAISRGVNVADGAVYFVAGDERRGEAYSLRASDGALLWRYSLDEAVPNWFTVQKDIVYILAQNGAVFGLRGSSGKLLWRYKDEPSTVSEPLVYLLDGILYLCSQSQKHFVALQADTGRLLWRKDTPFVQIFLDAIAGITYIGSGDGAISAVRAQDGTLLWRAVTSMTQFSMSISFAASRDVAYLITQNGTLDARRARDGTLLWQYAQSNPIWGKLVLDERNLYIGAYNGTIYALRNDGTPLWHYRTKQAVGLLIPARDRLFVQSNSEGDGVYAFRASDGALLWTHEMGQAAYYQSGSFTATERIVYITTVDGTINALSGSDGRRLWSRHALRPPQALGGLLYSAEVEGGISAIWAESGAVRWHTA